MKQKFVLFILTILLCSSICFGVTGCQDSRPAYNKPVSPTPAPTSVAITVPMATITVTPTEEPTELPTEVPTETPTEVPTETPTVEPTETPSPTPTPTPKVTIPHLNIEPTAIPESLDPTKPMIALTFDDGPTSSITNRILDVLEQYNAKATFFVVGNRLGSTKNQQAMSRAFSLGCEIGSHSYSHPKMNSFSHEKIQEEYANATAAIEKIIGIAPTLFRPPYGFYNDAIRAYFNAPLIFWSVDPKDWSVKDAAKIYDHIIKNVKDGDIVLMHDLHSYTAEACEALIPALLAEGYQLVTVSELFACKGITLTTGNIYRKAR